MINIGTICARVLRAGAVCLSAWALASAVGAQPADAPSAEAARAQAEAALTDANLRGLFQNVTDSTTPELEHRASGARCRFWNGSVSLEAVEGEAPVGCETSRGGFTLLSVIYPATEAYNCDVDGQDVSVSTGPLRVMAAQIAACVAEPDAAVTIEAQRSLRGLPGSGDASFVVARISRPDGQRLGSLRLAEVRGWIVGLASIGRAGDAALDRTADTTFERLVRSVRRAPEAPSPPPPPPPSPPSPSGMICPGDARCPS